MDKRTVSLIIDDSTPRVHVFASHANTPTAGDGKALLRDIPNRFLEDFCDVVEACDLKGKFSVVPMPGCRGDIVNGIEGVPYDEVAAWLDTAKTRLKGRFSFCPEMLTHHKAVNLHTGGFYEANEKEWAKTQNRASLAEYIARALTLLKDAGIFASGVTSPWDFGIEVEDDYAAAVSDAVYEVWGETLSWYFCRCKFDEPGAGPWEAFAEKGRRVFSIPATVNDAFWETIDSPETSEEYVKSVADKMLTEDGTRGAFASAMNAGAMPILVTHWQSLFSNGKQTGIRALEIAARRIQRHYGSQIEWKSFEEILRAAANG